jgi:hypothetical protein
MSREELKLLAMARYTELYELTGITLRDLAKAVKRSKSCVYYWVNPDADDRIPKPEFVLFLEEQIAERVKSIGTARCA